MKRLQHILLTALICCATTSAWAQEQSWKINIKNGDIHEFVSQVAEITGKTFIIDPRLKGNVTVMSNTRMDKDAIYALFLSVLRVHNFTATSSGNVIRIQQNAMGKQTPGAQGSLSDVAAEELVTRVIAAQNVDSSELMKILRPLIPQYGHIAAVAQPNIVIISDHADNILRLTRIIRQIDVADEDEMHVLPMKEAWVGNVVALLEKVAPDQIGRNAKGPQRIQLIANERNNTLIVKGKSRPVAEVLKLVSKLDQPATATGSTQVIYLHHGEATKIAEILNGLVEKSGGGKSESDGGTQLSIQADESLNALVIKADPSRIAEIKEIVASLDVRRAQVLIEAAIVEVSLEDRRNLGVEMAAVDGAGETVPLISTSLNGTISSLLGNIIGEDGEISPLSGLNSVTSPTLAAAKIDANAISFGAVITALETNSDANLLSTPSIMTLDNQEAKIVVGSEVPFRTGSFTTSNDGASNPFTTIQRQDVGLQLAVTPHVHDGSSVRMEVSQEVTNVVDSAVSDAGFSDVVTSKRTIDTTVLAENKQTIVLGGLIQDDITDTVRKVPLLGDVPVLGHLFRSTTKSRKKLNLLVFLRPTVIKTKEDASAVTDRKYQHIYEVEIESSGTGFESIDALVDGERLESDGKRKRERRGF